VLGEEVVRLMGDSLGFDPSQHGAPHSSHHGALRPRNVRSLFPMTSAASTSAFCEQKTKQSQRSKEFLNFGELPESNPPAARCWSPRAIT
jgi:hypothetical protein